VLARNLFATNPTYAQKKKIKRKKKLPFSLCFFSLFLLLTRETFFFFFSFFFFFFFFFFQYKKSEKYRREIYRAEAIARRLEKAQQPPKPKPVKPVAQATLVTQGTSSSSSSTASTSVAAQSSHQQLVDSTGRAFGSDNAFADGAVVREPLPDSAVVVPDAHAPHRATFDLSVAVPKHAPLYESEVGFDEHVDVNRVRAVGADNFYRFRAHVGWLIQSNGADDEFAQLFHSTQSEFTAERCADSLLNHNRDKNRYANVLPYDFNRVRLLLPRYATDADAVAAAPRAPSDDPDDDGDYINGSYLLPDFDERAAANEPAQYSVAAAQSCPYIATQGPKPNTIGSFWRMVWRQRTACVVMLGQPIENGVAKFSTYWPESSHDLLEVDEFQVKPERSVDYGEYVKRVYTLTNTAVGETRYVLHFLFTSFPDHGIPATTAGFLHLVEMAELETLRSHERLVTAKIVEPRSPPSPVVIHCFPEADHQLLTNRGFMFLRDVEAHVCRDAATGDVVDWRGLAVASFDPQRQQLVYRQPRRLVVNQQAGAEMLEFSDRHEQIRWQNGNNNNNSDDGMIVDDNQLSMSTSVIATRGHRMLVRDDGEKNEFMKLTAQQLAERKSAAVRFLAVAAGGVAGAHSASSLGLTESLIELHGFLIGGGARTSAFARSRIAAVASSSSLVDEALCATLIASWAWQLDVASLRHFVVGLCAVAARDGSGRSVEVVSTQMRDELVQLLMHAGHTATFAATSDSKRWRVTLADATSAVAQPRLDAHEAAGVASRAACRTWCFDMDDGFVVVRRARCDASGSTVVQASRATIQGNCSAGLGRTGVYCSIAMTLRKMGEARRDAFALYDTMMALRRQRAGMMQTRDQLLFCYLAILDCATPLFTDVDFGASPMFHATLQSDAAAEAALAGGEVGTYLFRPSAQQGHVTLSVRTPAGADEEETAAAYAHLPVQCQPGGFVLHGSGVLYLSLEELACGEADLCRRPILQTK
jgi:protein tyrosine phosphatase